MSSVMEKLYNIKKMDFFSNYFFTLYFFKKTSPSIWYVKFFYVFYEINTLTRIEFSIRFFSISCSFAWLYVFPDFARHILCNLYYTSKLLRFLHRTILRTLAHCILQQQISRIHPLRCIRYFENTQRRHADARTDLTANYLKDDEFHTQHLIFIEARIRKIYERDVSAALNVTQTHAEAPQRCPTFSRWWYVTTRWELTKSCICIAQINNAWHRYRVLAKCAALTQCFVPWCSFVFLQDVCIHLDRNIRFS